MLKVSHTDLNEPWYSRNFEMELLSNGLAVGCCAFCRLDRNVPILYFNNVCVYIYCTLFWGRETLHPLYYIHLLPLAFSNFLPFALT